MNLRSIEDLERNNFFLVAEILESTIQRAIHFYETGRTND